MRVISQDGTIDVPYEQVVIQRFNRVIYFLNKNLTGVESVINDMEMASYSTEEKAKKAMEMLREKYLTRMELDGGFDHVNKVYVQPNYWVLPKVFQFPAEEELE
ncbi:hypothetical protein [Roseburia sp. 831b]|uniref:hypothetical protein n=1 Tax=Roseburia sp. 831b TaxID=1261635 RepID=UPI0009524762|nr:hypothetical protein [Roseburia sp. 831b]WVK74262.1 hypothetical protein BIV16_07025 [Roseburia sp. 831b]